MLFHYDICSKEPIQKQTIFSSNNNCEKCIYNKCTGKNKNKSYPPIDSL